MNWSIENNKIERDFIFEDFKQALEFVNMVGGVAEDMDHHPTILMHSYKKVNIKLTTSEEGNIVTELDHKMAKKIDEGLKTL
ncbi:4a-hydroxytetrahydrobiopterin dehydratase [Brumimicrobium glaciale]|jgi:4a-hydroxytetrahydrobiopterin dehydratase|uniref:4a-hydroxytetrahydrobiopterin dehydratase n=1 Tax=Brumimicrobium glaciale TaxID=200475 RepID=A0A4Q4KM09_9FLAO|nr:4a-hydroxytetrahydrobiopterin dehydratase [Brumimicrobium glaciale]RYM32909.1 4a-hydroxytetrahydrobiopterin dehydratase [Brumimicrobium glaciale]